MPSFRYFFSCIIVFGAVLACTSQPEKLDVASYKAYFNSKKYPLRFQKEISDLNFTIEYLPAEMMTCRASSNSSNQKYLDSLTTSFSNSLSFLFKIDYTEDFKSKGAKGSVLGYDIGGFSNFKERVYNLNFGLKEYVKLSDGVLEISPVLTEFEDTYDLTSDRKFIVVFNKEEFDKMKGHDVTLSFDDQFWGTGIHQYAFSKEKIDHQPKLIAL